MESNVVQIKKYGNRRFYSSTDTRFVTIEEIARMVRRGDRVRVVDAETSREITAEVLTQILLEEGRARHLPVDLLEQMLRLNDETLKNFWGAYLGQSLEMLRSLQQSFRTFNPFLTLVGGLGAPGAPGATDDASPAPPPEESKNSRATRARKPSRAGAASRSRKPPKR